MSPTPEQKARQDIDAALVAAGWVIQDRAEMNLGAGTGVVVREFPMASGHGFADYLLFVNGKAVGVLEAKPAGYTLGSVELQPDKYATGLPAGLNPPVNPLPFLYLSTGVETRFINGLDPEPKTRAISANLPEIHRPETLAEWIAAETLDTWVKRLHAEGSGLYTAADDTRPSSLRGRITTMPPLERGALYPNQIEAVTNLERSLKRNRPRALIQMATGSGKTIAAITAIYRLIKYAGARRVLFLVDRNNLGEQADKEFQGYRAPDVNRKFTELYNVQRLSSNTIMDSSRVVISTIQRVYSMLRGEPDFDSSLEEGSQFETSGAAFREPLPVVYNAAYPPEYFDVVVIDEVHRSIYTLWRQVVEYFDAFLIGLTATPSKQTLGFFSKNLVMEYDHDRAVADCVNVDFDVYNIRTKISARGATVEAGPETMLGYRDRQTRALRWESPDEDLTYNAEELDRRVVARDQIRTIIRTFRDRLPVDVFPGRKEVPKTLIFAKDDSHADTITQIVREEFGRGNEFCQKITYQTHRATGVKPEDLIASFRNSYYPRIAVTVDMVATGTDIKPLEVLLFLRLVKSQGLFEQMKGRGSRVIADTDFAVVTPDGRSKTHAVLVDAVGVSELLKTDEPPLERKRSVSFGKLLEAVAVGADDDDTLSTLAGRLGRLAGRLSPTEAERVAELTGGRSVRDLARGLVQALDADQRLAVAITLNGDPFLSPDGPGERVMEEARRTLAREALAPFDDPDLRDALTRAQQRDEQTIDLSSEDEVLYQGVTPQAEERARQVVGSFRAYLEQHQDEIAALQLYYSRPRAAKLDFREVKRLAEAIEAPPLGLTEDALWQAYARLDRDRVRDASGQRVLTDLVALVRYALERDRDASVTLEPFAEGVQRRFTAWLVEQERRRGQPFSEEQRRWLEMIRDHVATSLAIDNDAFDDVPFNQYGGLGKASQLFGAEMPGILTELNERLVA